MKKISKFLQKKISGTWKKTLLGYLLDQTSPKAWSLSENKLFDFNNTAITLSSSALVLSFTAIQIGKPLLNKNLLGWTWGVFLSVIIMGVVLIYVKFLRSLSNEITKISSERGKYGKANKGSELPDRLLNAPEFNFVYQTQSLMYILSLLQLMLFSLAFLLLILTAYLAL